MRRRRDPLTISLFPFLSILACVIGTLTLMISAMVVGEMVPPASAATTGSAREELEEGPQRYQPGDDLGDALAEPRGGSDVLAGRDAPGAPEALGGDAAVGGEALPLAGEVPGSAPEPASRDPLGSGELPPSARGEGLRLPLVVDYFDPRDARRHRPGFVLCDEDGVVLDVQESEGPRERVPENVILSSPELAEYLQRVGGETKGIVVFLIRPGGVESYERALAVAERERVRHGSLPVPSGRQLDFSRLERAGKEPR